MRPLPRSPVALVLLLAVALAPACARRVPDAGASPPPSARPLARFLAQPMVVVPVQRLRGGDALGWASEAGAPPELLARLDDELAFAVMERGTASAWVFAPAVARAARRSPTVIADPYQLAVEQLLDAKAAPELAGPLPGQLRTLVAMSGSRYVVVPSELRFERRADGAGEAVLRLAVVDARMARRVWAGEVRSDAGSTFSRGLLTSLAGHFADLIAVPEGTDGA